MYVLCVCLCLFTFACTFMHICVRLCLYFCYLFLLYVQVFIHMYICLRLNTHAFLLNICSDNEWMNKLRRKPTSKRKHTHTRRHPCSSPTVPVLRGWPWIVGRRVPVHVRPWPSGGSRHPQGTGGLRGEVRSEDLLTLGWGVCVAIYRMGVDNKGRLLKL